MGGGRKKKLLQHKLETNGIKLNSLTFLFHITFSHIQFFFTQINFILQFYFLYLFLSHFTFHHKIILLNPLKFSYFKCILHIPLLLLLLPPPSPPPSSLLPPPSSLFPPP